MSLNIIEIRHHLHAHPELSGKEEQTHDYIVQILKTLQVDCIISHVGGNGVVAVFEGKKEGRNIAIRGDMDALPISETTELSYKSVNEGVGHKCGHDGHTAILLHLAEKLSKNRPENGNIILIFQPEEETGNGALKMMKSNVLQPLNIDFIFGLHNLPNFPLGAVVIKRETFAAASSGMIIKLHGRETHAAHPENGINPAMAVSDLIQLFDQINTNYKNIADFQQTTLIYCRIGKVAFGTSAGDAEVMVTLRAFSNKLMKTLIENVLQQIREISNQYHLETSHSFQDEFLAVENNDFCVEMIEKAAKKSGKKLVELEVPFRWSEDFSHYLTHYQGAFFGIGSGEQHVELHHPDYDFPDELVEMGSDIFANIISMTS